MYRTIKKTGENYTQEENSTMKTARPLHGLSGVAMPGLAKMGVNILGVSSSESSSQPTTEVSHVSYIYLKVKQW